MKAPAGGASRLLVTMLALAEPRLALMATASLAASMALLTSSIAEAQTAWGVSRRTARRTTHRTAARQGAYYGAGAVATPYLGVLPAGYRTVTVGGATYYEAEGTRYEAKIIEGQTVYVRVN